MRRGNSEQREWETPPTTHMMLTLQVCRLIIHLLSEMPVERLRYTERQRLLRGLRRLVQAADATTRIAEAKPPTKAQPTRPANGST